TIDRPRNPTTNARQDLAQAAVIFAIVVDDVKCDHIRDSSIIQMRNANGAGHMVDSDVFTSPTVSEVSKPSLYKQR
ncbi:hypothetical protein CPI04_08725, partial [Moraxella catarrhalis]|nr:hypothetical protein [Moraxella catarrhalis]